MKFRICLLILFFTAKCFAARAQNDSAFLHRAIQLAGANSEKVPIEKVYLHLDKPYYAAGDDIWFKAYLTAGAEKKLSGISGVLNVELIDFKNKVAQAVKLPLAGGIAWGDFKLPDTIKAGYYHLRAYTRWMRNAGSEYFYDRTIYIGNAITAIQNNNKGQKAQRKAAEIKGKPLAAKTDIQFFPEGGSLVYDIRSKIAFKALGDDGLGKDIKGVVTDEHNDQVASFSTQHLGMGKFDLLPLEGKTYKALVTFADGSQKGIDLPAPLAKGYVMHIDNTDPLFIEVKIEASKDLTGEAGLNLIATSGGKVCYAAKSKSASSSFSTMVPKRKFPAGIAQFALFSSQGEPLSERLVFIAKPGQLNVTILASGGTFATRGKTQISVEAKSAAGKPAFGRFSVSVIDETKVQIDENTESTILSTLLLTSDLPGYIEKPNYYFSDQNACAGNDLDLLMLTQGYRRFVWKQILNNGVTPLTWQPELSLAISGQLKTLGGGRGIPYGKVSLMSSTHGFIMLDTTADGQGYFAFRNLQFNDSTAFVIQSRKGKDSKRLQIVLDSIATPPVIANSNLPQERLSTDSDFSVYLDNSAKLYKEQLKYGIGGHPRPLKEVKILERKTLSNSSNLNGPGNADQVLFMKNISGACPAIANCIGGYLRGVIFQYDLEGIGHPVIYVNGHPVEMQIKIDGFNATAEVLNSLTPELVESVEVLRSGGFTSIYGPEGSNGLLLINTKHGGYTAVATPNIISYMPKGYYKAREFYTPQYDDPKNSRQMVDLRSTIYWNPNIVTDKDGSACFDYFNADARGTYRIVLEGIDEDGNLGRQVYRYKVE